MPSYHEKDRVLIEKLWNIYNTEKSAKKHLQTEEFDFDLHMVMSALGFTSLEQFDFWLGSVIEICAFIHCGRIYISRFESGW